jgi:hypothetical protein
MNKFTENGIVEDVDFKVKDDTPIGFGKLRGKPHKELLKTTNENYKKWIIDQGPEFKYCLTRNYILENMIYGYKVEIEDAIQTLIKYKSKINKHEDLKEDLMEILHAIEDSEDKLGLE